MTTPPSTFPPPRVTPRLGPALGGVWRLTVRRYLTPTHALTLAGMLVALVVFAIPAVRSQGQAARAYFPWVANFYLCLLVPLLAFITAGGAIRDDHGAGTTDYVFTRPVPRVAYVIFRYLSHLGCLQVNFLFALAVVVAIGLVRDVPGVWAAVPWLVLAQVVAVTVFSAFGVLCGMLTSRYIIVGLAYGGIVEVGLGNVPTQLSRISMTRHTLGILQPAIGGDRSVLGRGLGLDPLSVPASVMTLLAITVVMVAAAALLFRWRELLGTPGKET